MEMMKTASSVEQDVYTLLTGSALASTVNGAVYRSGYRPAGSGKEDIVVVYTSGDARQIQDGIVTVLIYVPDIEFRKDRRPVKDGARCSQLEAAALTWFGGLNTAQNDYRFTLDRAIQTVPDPDTREHFVSLRLRFRHLTDN